MFHPQTLHNVRFNITMCVMELANNCRLTWLQMHPSCCTTHCRCSHSSLMQSLLSHAVTPLSCSHSSLMQSLLTHAVTPLSCASRTNGLDGDASNLAPISPSSSPSSKRLVRHLYLGWKLLFENFSGICKLLCLGERRAANRTFV